MEVTKPGAAAAESAGAAAGARQRVPLFVAVVASALLGSLPFCPVATAQQPPPAPVDARPWFADVSHYGKWVALAGSASLMAVAILRNQDADQVYDGLAALCRTGGETCVLNAEGTYSNPDAELLYQETLRLDSQARKWMIGGQAALVAAGAMFVVDLVAGTRKPKNIPYAAVEYFVGGRQVGVRVRF